MNLHPLREMIVMPRVPKKAVNRFISNVPKFQKVLQVAKDRDINESDTVEIITDMLESIFGYDKYLEVTSEFAIRGQYCDVAVKIDGKVQFLIEAKAVGIDLKEKHLRQAINYAANHGVQWIVLTNGMEWRLYRLRFKRPINHDLVLNFDLRALNPKQQQCQEQLFLLSKEGLEKDARQEFFEKVQVVNQYIIGGLILQDPILKIIKRELSRMSEGVKVNLEDVEQIVKSAVLRRNLIEGDEAEDAQKRIARFYKKRSSNRRKKIVRQDVDDGSEDASLDRPLPEELLEESESVG